MPAPLPMPIHLSAADTAHTPSGGRMVFVVDAAGIGEPVDLFGKGLHAVFGNYLTARVTGGGLAALCDDATFLRAVRSFADRVYRAAGVVVDASPTNVDAPHVIAGVYPDATFLVVDPLPPEVAARVDLIEHAQVRHVTRDELPAVVARSVDFWSEVRTEVDQRRPTMRAPVFVVGCPRSGTTWVQNLLASHPGLGGPTAETAVFVAIRALRDNPAVEIDALRGFVSELFAAWSDVRVIEKTPIHALHLDLIAELFPDAQIVGVHRDGRDVVRSLLEVEAGTRDAASAARFWVEVTRTVRAFAASSPRARDERYEDWLANPVIGAIDVLTWLGLSPDESVIDELRRRAPTRVSQYNTTGAVGEGKWLDLSERDLRAVYRVAGAWLREMGYPAPVTTRGSRIERFLRGARRR